jgi:hypothetical protein
MDPVSLALMFFLKHPDMATSMAKSTTKPAVVDVEKAKSSFADLSMEILKCYHKTARYELADVLVTPWSRQGQYSAEKSAVIKIQFTGMSSSRYEMQVAVMKQDEKIRTVVLSENTLVPYNKKCQLEQWS